MADVLEGETERFGELVERYKNLVASYIAARVPADEVDDLAQEVFLRAFRGLPSLRDPAAFSSWLLGIANHVCIDWHRSRDRLPSLDPEVAVSAESVAPHRPRPSQPHEKVERQEAARLLLESLDQLPETYRVTLVLKHMEGLSCAQIAARLDVALGTVTSRLARGYKLLRAKLERTADATRMPSE
ncbi:MAG: RNA polymerase sigma factor [Candidatus Brocadiia bacterium]